MNQSTTNKPVKQRKPRPRPERSLRVLKPIDHTRHGIIEITVGSDVNDYGLQLLGPAYDGQDLGIELQKDDGQVYHVCLAVDPARTTCDCHGFQRWIGSSQWADGRGCKHLDAARRLLELGLLVPPAEIVIDIDGDALPAALELDVA